MPQYKTHLLAGFFVFLLIFLLFQSTNIFGHYSFLYMISCLLGSLFPDIDTKSMIQKFLYFILFAITIVAVLSKQWEIAVIISLISLIPLIVNHRKLTHRIWFVILIPFAIPIVTFHYNKAIILPIFVSYLFFVLGAISHILLDFGIFKTFKRK
ncbi:metal-dependent hydrolase [Candidatus Dependentiae bacterium]|nr:metal-dependent hydrolase [Candidatus Dependentiae bacterium]MBU4387725.1 metal-dependent hydrolase [Candidatus Dependentiae bacterium]MCG2755982.1 metal-dependent hydrolase [Candidatus Dependentiae bacterium]